jgi:hypothetical protein
MAEKVVVKLNKNQQAAIKKAVGTVCDSLEFDREDLIHMLMYMPAPVFVDFDEGQLASIKRAVPNSKCNFAVMDGKDLCGVLRYMPPPNSVLKYMPPPKGVVKYMPPPIIVKYMPPAVKK